MCLGAATSPCAAQHMNAPDAPCRDVAVTALLDRCLRQAYVAADQALNRVYGDIRAALAPADRQYLQDAERDWVKFRDAICAAERHLYEGGTGASPAFSACLEDETRRHVRDLRAIYDWKVTKATP